MEKERRIRVLSLATLIIAVLGLTVAFAALSQTLTINGNASVDAATWDVHFTGKYDREITGEAKELSAPEVGGLTINNLQVSLKKPGDSISYDFEIINSGDIDAELYDYLIFNLSGNNSDDCDNECIKEALRKMYPKADWNGDGVTTDEERQKISEIMNCSITGAINNGSNMLYINQTDHLILDFYFLESATELPKGEVEMNVDLQYLFKQV